MTTLPTHEELTVVLKEIQQEANGGFGFHMWATVVDRDGVVKIVTFSGEDRHSQWPGSRVISAQKAYTANAFSLPKFALSTANLYAATQPGGSLYGLQHSNPIDVSVTYDDAKTRGTKNDSILDWCIGGVNVFGGGLALYAACGKLLGGLGVSGDSSCADHNIAWKIRHALELDYVPAGVGDNNSDNIINVASPGWGHPVVTEEAADIAAKFFETHPIRKAE